MLIMAYNITDSADIGSKGIGRITNSSAVGIGSSNRTLPSSELPAQGEQNSLLHGNLLAASLMCFPNFVVGLN